MNFFHPRIYLRHVTSPTPGAALVVGAIRGHAPVVAGGVEAGLGAPRGDLPGGVPHVPRGGGQGRGLGCGGGDGGASSMASNLTRRIATMGHCIRN